MTLKDRYRQTYPESFYLMDHVEDVQEYLLAQKWLNNNESLVSLEKPGEGNMNCVLRVTTNQRSFILKQARPWVEKYPHISAPTERASVEALFYKTIESINLSQYAPRCLGFDAHSHVLVTEDLGKAADFSFLYQSNQLLEIDQLNSLLGFLTSIHRVEPPLDFPSNMDMRLLNHEHIFNLPYEMNNGFNLDDIQEGLQAISIICKNNVKLKQKIQLSGAIYLSKGKHLLHGDFYPGSWLNISNELKIIDPEFAFVGPLEFDLGVLIAHLMMSQQKTDSITYVLNKYRQTLEYDGSLLAQYAGIEIMRRLIGLAQLPLDLDLNVKRVLLDQAIEWVITEKISI